MGMSHLVRVLCSKSIAEGCLYINRLARGISSLFLWVFYKISLSRYDHLPRSNTEEGFGYFIYNHSVEAYY